MAIIMTLNVSVSAANTVWLAIGLATVVCVVGIGLTHIGERKL